MPDPQRVEFITRHFKDLQSIRFAPVPAALLLLPPLALLVPQHMSKGVAWAVVLAFVFFLFFAIWFYRWSTGAIKRRYGSVKESRFEAQRMLGHPVIIVLYIIMGATLAWFYFFAHGTRHPYLYSEFILLITLLRTILDSTNPAMRRLVWAIGLVALCGGLPLLILNGVDSSVATCLLGGTVWLSISIFDFLLLRRTFAGISGSRSTGATGTVAQYG